jgi:hypothetical protein
VSQGEVTATICTEELFTALSIYRSPHIHIRWSAIWGGRIWAVNTAHSAGPAGSHTSQPDLTKSYKASDIQLFCEEGDKAIFLFPVLLYIKNI